MKQIQQTNRDSAVVAVSLRARQLIDGYEPVIEPSATKAVPIALEELEAGKIRWQQRKNG